MITWLWTICNCWLCRPKKHLPGEAEIVSALMNGIQRLGFDNGSQGFWSTTFSQGKKTSSNHRKVMEGYFCGGHGSRATNTGWTGGSGVSFWLTYKMTKACLGQCVSWKSINQSWTLFPMASVRSRVAQQRDIREHTPSNKRKMQSQFTIVNTFVWGGGGKLEIKEDSLLPRAFLRNEWFDVSHVPAEAPVKPRTFGDPVIQWVVLVSLLWHLGLGFCKGRMNDLEPEEELLLLLLWWWWWWWFTASRSWKLKHQ